MTKLLPKIVAATRQLRRDIHAHPELAFNEFRTAQIVAQRLKELGFDVSEGHAVTGVIGTMARGEGPSIGLRADLDGLPIQEETGLEYASRHAGKMHACGHDGHVAMLLGAAEALAQDDEWTGRLVLIFQPAEENECGAKKMIEEGLFDQYPVDSVWAMHNWPDLPAGTIAVKPGEMMAAFELFEIRLNGQGGHAAIPHEADDVILAASELVSQLQSIVSRKLDPAQSAVCSVTQFHAGDAWNVLPSSVTLKGGCRYFSDDVGDTIRTEMESIVRAAAERHGLECEVKFDQRYVPTLNDAACAEHAAWVARSVVDPANVRREFAPSMASEDFGFMLRECPGAYIWIGNRSFLKEAPLHSPKYDFNDDVIELGIKFWHALARSKLVGPANS